MIDVGVDPHVLIPILWAVLAAALALVLYKTSTGMFGQEDGGKDGKRKLRLTGSIVMAGVIFFGLKWATPSQLLVGECGPQPDAAAAQKAKVDAVMKSLQDLDACAEITVPQQCRTELDALQDKVEGLKD